MANGIDIYFNDGKHNPKINLQSVHDPVHDNTVVSIDVNIHLSSIDYNTKITPVQLGNLRKILKTTFHEFHKAKQKVYIDSLRVDRKKHENG